MGQSNTKVAAPLVQAALIKDFDEVNKLIKNGELPSTCDAQGNHPLGAAACSGSLEIVELLLKADAPVNLKNNMECSPLWLAAGYGHLEILECLIEAGGNPNDVNNTGDSPLVAAAFKANYKCVERLLKHPETDVSIENKNQDTILSLAAGRGLGDIVQSVIDLVAEPKKKEMVNRVNAKGVSPLGSAAAFGDSRSVRCLLTAGADVYMKDKNGATPLMISAHCGHAQCVIDVLEFVSDERRLEYLETGDEQGATALWLASANGSHETVKALLDVGADSSGGNPGGVSANEAAIKNGNMKCSELLSTVA